MRQLGEIRAIGCTGGYVSHAPAPRTQQWNPAPPVCGVDAYRACPLVRPGGRVTQFGAGDRVRRQHAIHLDRVHARQADDAGCGSLWFLHFVHYAADWCGVSPG
ncbi:hypothetical protein GCM10010276_22220 [Streptomyces longisporus]|uniref:Uncharacterized protein n=1 Tax=Streptomyces longisporus TaxID=1948 RepID=A0ABP5YUR2_STRLO